MQRIISAQHGNPNITPEKLTLANCTKDILATKNGKVKNIDMKTLNLLARTLGAPLDLTAGVYLHYKLGESVKKGTPVFTLYADEPSKIDLAMEFLKEKTLYIIA